MRRLRPLCLEPVLFVIVGLRPDNPEKERESKVAGFPIRSRTFWLKAKSISPEGSRMTMEGAALAAAGSYSPFIGRSGAGNVKGIV